MTPKSNECELITVQIERTFGRLCLSDINLRPVSYVHVRSLCVRECGAACPHTNETIASRYELKTARRDEHVHGLCRTAVDIVERSDVWPRYGRRTIRPSLRSDRRCGARPACLPSAETASRCGRATARPSLGIAVDAAASGVDEPGRSVSARRRLRPPHWVIPSARLGVDVVGRKFLAHTGRGSNFRYARSDWPRRGVQSKNRAKSEMFDALFMSSLVPVRLEIDSVT